MENWLEDIHTQDCWDKTNCPMQTEVFTWKDDDGYNELRGYTFDIDGLETVETKSITVDRVFRKSSFDDKDRKSTWDIDVEIFVYKDYIYTVSSEHIHDAQTFTCQSIMRRPLTI